MILIFNIITTNRNNTAMAPTYTTKKIIAKNSTSNKISNPVALQNTKIKNKTEWIGFFAPITITEEANIKNEKKKNKFVIKKSPTVVIIYYILLFFGKVAEWSKALVC